MPPPLRGDARFLALPDVGRAVAVEDLPHVRLLVEAVVWTEINRE